MILQGHKNIIKVLRALILFMPLSSLAQQSDLGNWLIYFGDKKINQRWNWHHEVQFITKFL